MNAKVLTTIAVEKIKPGPARREIPDARMPGLYFIVQPSGAKSWAVRYKFGGKPRKLTIGGFPAFDLVAARKRASEALQAVADSQDPAREKRKNKAAAKLARPERDAFPAVAELFVNRHARPNTRSWKESARLLGLRPHKKKPDVYLVIEGGLAERWRETQIGDLAKRDIIDLLDEIVDRGAETAANRTLAQLRKMLNWCVERDILAASPCAGIKAPAKENSRDRVLSDDEIRWLWKAAGKQGYPFGPMAQLLLLTAQRREEVAAMSVTEIDLEKRIWTIPKERAKNKKPSEVPLSDAALAIIAKLPRIAGPGYLFTKTGATPVSGFSRAKRRLDELMAEEADGTEIPQWGYHDLRRVGATGMAALKVAPHVCEAVLNHKSGTIKGVAAVYNKHKYGPEKRAALDAWARRVEEIATGRSSKVIKFPARG